MLQTYSPQNEAFYEGGGQAVGLSHYIEILKRRSLWGIVAFSIVLLLGAFVTAIQVPIYHAEGKVLVESQQIPSDLVQPTVTDSASERIQVIEQRILTRDNLLGIMKKYGMFARERQWMSDSDLLDLMRQRTSFELVETQEDAKRPAAKKASTIAFSVSFEYENPQITQRVANDYLTLILAEDARNRTNRATETTNFLASESQRLQAELAAVSAQIAQIPAQTKMPATADPANLTLVELTKLKEDLAQKSSIYSDAHPYIIVLKKKIAAMEALIAKSASQRAAQVNSGLIDLERKQLEIQKSLDANNKKLEAARLGERMERDQQSERLQVIEQPALPQYPVKPNRVKFLAVAFALALAAGLGVIVGLESLDGSIRQRQDLLGVANGRMIVSIPYIATRTEMLRKKSRVVVVVGIIGALLLAGVISLLFFGPPIDLSSINQFWVDNLTRLSK
jgi:protein tyrosine kinase modulator